MPLQFKGLTVSTDLDEDLSLYRVPKTFHERLSENTVANF